MIDMLTMPVDVVDAVGDHDADRRRGRGKLSRSTSTVGVKRNQNGGGMCKLSPSMPSRIIITFLVLLARLDVGLDRQSVTFSVASTLPTIQRDTIDVMSVFLLWLTRQDITEQHLG